MFKSHFPFNVKILCCCDMMYFVNLKILLLAIAIGLLLALVSPLFLVLGVVRFTVWLLALIFRRDLQALVSGIDAIYATNNSLYPPGCNLVFCVLEGSTDSLNVQALRAQFYNRILKSKNKKLYSRYRQYWASFLGFAFWKWDRNFSLRNHIREYDYRGPLALPSGPICIEKDLSKLAGCFQNLKWIRDTSPWELLLIPAACRSDASKDLNTVLMLRIHHLLGDGYSIISTGKELFSIQCRLPESRANNERSLKLPWIRTLALPFQCCYDLAEYTIKLGKAGKLNFDTHHTKGGREQRFECATSAPVDIQRIKDVTKLYSVSFASILHTSLARALKRTLEQEALDVPASLNFLFPLPKPKHPPGAINHVLLGQEILPLQIQERLDHLKAINDLIAGTSKSRIATTDVISAIVGLLPVSFRSALKNNLSKNGPLSLSTIPITADRVVLNGLRALDMITFVPATDYGFTVIGAGLNGQIRFGFTSMHRSKGQSVVKSLASNFDDELKSLLEVTVRS